MAYAAKDYTNLIGMQGFSEMLLKNHFTLYQGYVANTNKLLDLIAQLNKENRTAGPEYAEIKRRLGWEFNGMRLHELYFGNLGATAPLNKHGAFARKLTEDFGGIDAWEKDFRGTGAMRGIGWSILYQDSTSGRLLNFWINEHDTGHPAGCNPVLIMDVFEHAFLIDYQTKKADYIEAFMKNINWTVVESRLDQFAQNMRKAG